MTHEQIVQALRNTCKGCNPTPCCEFEFLGFEAANLIEELTARAEEAEAKISTAEVVIKEMTYEEKIVWHEVVKRPLTEEEKEYSGKDCKYMLDCALPEDGQEILIATTRWGVCKDICGTDDGYYLEGLGDWGNVIAWAAMPTGRAGNENT